MLSEMDMSNFRIAKLGSDCVPIYVVIIDMVTNVLFGKMNIISMKCIMHFCGEMHFCGVKRKKQNDIFE